MEKNNKAGARAQKNNQKLTKNNQKWARTIKKSPKMNPQGSKNRFDHRDLDMLEVKYEVKIWGVQNYKQFEVNRFSKITVYICS